MVKSDRNSKKLFIILKKISPDLNEVRNFSFPVKIILFSSLFSAPGSPVTATKLHMK